ncbi:MAG TPA: hypothetical protein VHZ78_01305 [Rhizomicrobium sp.]|jgi:hypothetical protein|nr:hypothetical protein [Rhizomicrobium sp.]
MTFIRAAALTAALLCSGCATVIEGTTQPITVATTPVSGADCVASNDRGRWPVVSPGTVIVQKSQSVLQIVCSKTGFADAKFFAAGTMSTTALISGFVPYVGMLNTVVDASSGASLHYQSDYVIALKPLPATPGATAIPAAPLSSPAPAVH